MINRIFLIVADSFGIGAAPDAAAFGDEGADTLGSVMNMPFFSAPVMTSLGLFAAHDGEIPENLSGAYGKAREDSAGKDTTVGHWEIAGYISENPLPTYPEGFPPEVTDAFEKATGRGFLCNKPYSGTKVIADYGEEHIKTGKYIVYTSADSVFQLAAHEDVVPLDILYADCEKARRILTGKHGVGRVIARPFSGKYPFTRTANRHDFSLDPPAKTILDVISEAGLSSIAVGKINDIFAGRGITEFKRTKSNAEGMKITEEYAARDFHGLCFVNLVEFDMNYGHRRDPSGYASALSELDAWLASFIPSLHEDDLLILTADHGCDPSFKGTDHTREFVPLLICGKKVKRVPLGTRKSFADTGKTILDILNLKGNIAGQSYKSLILE